MTRWIHGWKKWESVWCVTVALVPLALLALTDRMAYDDAYITYRYARNLATGRGFCYNPGEAVLGTTTPFYALLLSLVNHLWSELPLASRAIGAICWSGTSLCAYALARLLGGRWAAAFASIAVALSAQTLAAIGMETACYICFFLLSFLTYYLRKYIICIVFLSLLTLVRADGVLLMFVLALDYVIRQKRFPTRLALEYIVLTAPWFVYSIIAFGSPFPNSLAAKMGQATQTQMNEIGGVDASFLYGLWHHAQTAIRDHWANGLLGLWVVGAMVQKRILCTYHLFLLAWVVIYIAGYAALGVIMFPWYYVPLIPPLSILASLGFARLAARTRNRHDDSGQKRWPRVALAIVAMSLLIIGKGASLRRELRADYPRAQTYRRVGEWLAANTHPDASVAMTEIGIIGYYADRYVVDTMGLVSPALTPYAYDWLQTLAFAIVHYEPDYAIVLPDTAWAGLIQTDWFGQLYALEEVIDDVEIWRRTAPKCDGHLPIPSAIKAGTAAAITSVEIESRTLRPGRPFSIRVHWRADTPMDEDLVVQLDLVERATQRVWAQVRERPMHGGAPSYLWRVGDDIPDEHLLSVPQAAPEGVYDVWIRVQVQGQSGDVELTDFSGVPLGGTTPLVALKIPPKTPHRCPSDSDPVDAQLGDIALRTYKVVGDLEPGAQLQVILCWQATQATSSIPDDYTVFVHLVSDTGMVAQSDAEPQSGHYPTSVWDPGETVLDSKALNLPEPLDAGPYRLLVGMYDLQTGRRLVATRASGERYADDSVPLRLTQ